MRILGILLCCLILGLSTVAFAEQPTTVFSKVVATKNMQGEIPEIDGLRYTNLQKSVNGILNSKVKDLLAQVGGSLLAFGQLIHQVHGQQGKGIKGGKIGAPLPDLIDLPVEALLQHFYPGGITVGIDIILVLHNIDLVAAHNSPPKVFLCLHYSAKSRACKEKNCIDGKITNFAMERLKKPKK